MAPDDRLTITPETVRALIAAQFPDFAHLPVTPVTPGGWDHRSLRLGAQMAVRLPSAARYAGQVVKEAAILPRLAPHLPLPVPRPLALGKPGCGYPFPWAITAWLPGAPVAAASLANPIAVACDLAAFLRALQAIDPGGGPTAGPDNFHRGGALGTCHPEVAACLATLDPTRAERAAALWAKALAPAELPPAIWVHGDIAPGNLLIRHGRLGAVIDFGLCAIGDPACDLVACWTLFDGPARAAFRTNLPADPALWARARGWALWKALLVLAGRSAPAPLERPPLAVIDAVLSEHDPG